MEEENFKHNHYKFNYELDDEGYLLSWREFPFDETKPYIECDVYPELIIGVTMVSGNNFVTDYERRAALIEKNKHIHELHVHLNNCLIWFEHYDIQVAEYNREMRMGITPSVDIVELDAIAETKRANIIRIRKELEELEG